MHATHLLLRRYSCVTLVDFRISRDSQRLWVLDMYDEGKVTVLYHTHVAHGCGYEDKKKNVDYREGSIPSHFG